MKTLAKNFLNGCLVLVPTVLTLYVVYYVFRKIDGLLGIRIPGVGFVVTVAIITGIGALTTNVLGKQLVSAADRLLTRLPLVKLIYTSLRDFMAAFVGDKRTFDRPVLVSLSQDAAIKVVGFITREDLTFCGLSDHVAVYFPQSINFAGQLLLMPRTRVTPIDVEPSQIFPFIVSGGMTGA